MSDAARAELAAAELASNGTLRAAINLANIFLVTGKTENGDPVGVGPGMCAAIAERLGVGVAYIPYPSPGALADDVNNGVWDIGTIGAEPARAETIDFTAAYVEIEATYMVPKNSPITAIDQIDREGVRIAVSERSAYDLFLTRHIKNAELVRILGLEESYQHFAAEGLDALAGLRPAMMPKIEDGAPFRLLDGNFTTVQQAIGTQKTNTAAGSFLADFVEEAKASGLVASLIEKHGVAGRLIVAPPA